MNLLPKDALQLRFPEPLETEFRADYFEKSLKSLRMSVLLGALLYALFGALDVLIFPESVRQAWLIRFGIVVPACLAVLLFSFSRHFRKFMQPAVFLLVVIGGAGIVGLMVVVRSPINYFHYAGLLLVLMYSYTFSKLWFSYTTAASWTIVLLYEIAAVGIIGMPLATLLNDNFFYVSANLIGMFSSYHRERYIRRDFLQNRMVRELEEKRHILEREKIIRDLHDVLGGITTNIRLLAEMGKNSDDLAAVRKTLAVISDLSREGLTEIKGFMQSLDAREITWQALAAELRSQGTALVEPHGFAFSITPELDGVEGRPGSLLWLNVLRIYKEALTNAVKHSGGKRIDVALRISRERFELSLQDNGRGIDQTTRGGRGLSHLRRRAEELGGSVVIENAGGARITLRIPLLAHNSLITLPLEHPRRPAA